MTKWVATWNKQMATNGLMKPIPPWTEKTYEQLFRYIKSIPDNRRPMDDKRLHAISCFAREFLRTLDEHDLDDLNSPIIKDRLRAYMEIPRKLSYQLNAIPSIRHLVRSWGNKKLTTWFEQSFRYRKPRSKDVFEKQEELAYLLDLKNVYKFYQELYPRKQPKYPINLKLFFRIGLCTGLRVEHLLQLRKKYFNIKQRWLKSWFEGKVNKDFNGCYYSLEVQHDLEEYLNTLKDDDILFNISQSMIEDYFKSASRVSQVRITAHNLRAIFENYAKKVMPSDDVEYLLGHVGGIKIHYDIHDIEQMKPKYDEAMELLLPAVKDISPEELKQQKIRRLREQLEQLEKT